MLYIWLIFVKNYSSRSGRDRDETKWKLNQRDETVPKNFIRDETEARQVPKFSTFSLETETRRRLSSFTGPIHNIYNTIMRWVFVHFIFLQCQGVSSTCVLLYCPFWLLDNCTSCKGIWLPHALLFHAKQDHPLKLHDSCTLHCRQGYLTPSCIVLLCSARLLILVAW